MWNSEETNLLIMQVEKRPVLYDKSYKNYKNKLANNKSFAEIQKIIPNKSRK